MAKIPLGPIRSGFAPWDDPAAKPFIEFRNVTKKFGEFTAVDDLSIRIYEREFFALLGPSGCGKTTIMRMLAGFEQPTSGELLLDGAELSGIPAYRRPVNMMFQSYALFPHLTVEKNIAFGLKQDGMPKAEIAERVGEMLAMVKLEPFARRKPHQLSGGQKQRVALARSLAKRPKVLLLDEPLGALDRKLREETQFELMDLQQELGMTFLIVTHDQEEAMTVADRIAVMDHGQMIQVAPPAEIYEQPISRYVADFIGDINVIESTVTGNDGGLVRLKAKAAKADLTVRQDIEVAADSTAWFAIRPEKVNISSAAPEDVSVNAVPGEVWDIGYLGDVSIYHVRLDTGETIRATRTNRERIVEDPISWEDKVWLSWRPDHGLVLTQ